MANKVYFKIIPRPDCFNLIVFIRGEPLPGFISVYEPVKLTADHEVRQRNIKTIQIRKTITYNTKKNLSVSYTEVNATAKMFKVKKGSTF